MTNQNVAKMTISVFDMVENDVGKEENAGYQHIILFLTVFSEVFLNSFVKSRDCVVKCKMEDFDMLIYRVDMTA